MTTTLTTRLRELMAEATPGPWACWDMDEFDYHIFEKKRGTAQDCRKSLMAVRRGRSHPEGPNIPRQRDPGRAANFNEMVANAELVCELVNNAPTIIRLLDAVDGAEKALEQASGGLNCAVQRFVLNDVGPSATVVHRARDAAREALATLRAAREGAR